MGSFKDSKGSVKNPHRGGSAKTHQAANASGRPDAACQTTTPTSAPADPKNLGGRGNVPGKLA